MKRKIEKSDMCFWILLVAVILVYLSRIQLGLADIDECFYLTIPYRLVQGDVLLVDEWHVTQLVGFLIFPIMKLYLLAFQNTDGIYLFFRYIYLFFLVMTTIISYVLLRRRDRVAAVAASIVFGLFTPMCLKALSYNTIGLMSVWLFVVIAVTDTCYYKIKHVGLGILLAVSVLCNPYMVMLYLAYSVWCLIKRDKESFGIKGWGLVTAGAGIILALFLIFLASRVSISEIIENIPYIFHDPAHKSKTIEDFLSPIVEFLVWFKWFFILFFVGIVIAVLNPKAKKTAYMVLLFLSMVLLILLAVFKTSGIGKHAIMLPLTLLGGLAFAFTEDKSWDLFVKGWIPGIIYAGCMNLSSNQGIYVICNACAVSSCISLFLIKSFWEENNIWSKTKYWFLLLCGVQIFSEVYVNLNYVYWEDDISLLSYKIEEGPLKGIYTTKEKKESYDINYENIRSIKNFQGKNILIFNYFSCGYLVAEEAGNGAFSAWMPEYNDLDDEKMIQYYKLHPEKVPEIIYVDTQTTCDWDEDEWNNWCEKSGYIKEDFPDGGSVLYLQ